MQGSPKKNIIYNTQCNPSKWNYNFTLLLDEYNLYCAESSYNEVIKFHLKCIMNECDKTKNLKNSEKMSTQFEFDDIDIYQLPSHRKLKTTIDNNENMMMQISAEDILNKIEMHSQRILFYLNHAKNSNCQLNIDVFSKIISTSFDYMLHNKLSSIIMNNNNNNNNNNNTNTFCEWVNKYLKHIINQQLRNHCQSLSLWQSRLSILLPLIFEGCLNRNQVDLSRDIWQLCETHNISIDSKSEKLYNDLSVRHFVRHGRRPPTNSNDQTFHFKDLESKLSVFPADSQNTSSISSGLPQPNDECMKLAKNLSQRSKKIAKLISMNEHTINVPSYGDDDKDLVKYSESNATKSFLTDMEHAITYCRKYNDIISGRILYQAFIDSKLSIKQHAAMATDFLFLLDYPQFRQYITSNLNVSSLNDQALKQQSSLVISPKDVMTLWPINPPQAFINKAFTILITYKDALGMKKLFDTVTLQSSEQKKRLSLTPKMFMLGSDLFAKQCENEEDDNLMNNVYWDYLWTLMESKRFKGARTKDSIGYVGNKLLKIIFNVNNKSLQENDTMLQVKRIYDTFKNYNLSLPLPLMQKLHSNLSNSLHKSWIRQIYIQQHHPNVAQEIINNDELIPLQSSMHIMNDWKWYIDSQLFNKSLEEGLYENLKPLRKLMIDGIIPTSHTLIHRILVTFSRSNNLYLPELKQFLAECQAHYQHAFSPKEKSLIVAMIKRYINENNYDDDVSSIISYLQSINISINTFDSHKETTTRTKGKKSYLKFVNPQTDTMNVTSNAMRFNVGETIQLCGLQQYSYLNGCLANVIGWYNKQNKTYPVQLQDNSHIVYVSPKNMRFNKHMIPQTLPQFELPKLLESNEDIQKPAVMQNSATIQNKYNGGDKLLHILKDQANIFKNGISSNQLKELWPLYFPSQEFEHNNDENLHDYIVINLPFQIDYKWNINQYPSQSPQRVYFYIQQNDKFSKPKQQIKMSTLNEFIMYLRRLIQTQSNDTIRLKDLCKACYSDIYESQKHIEKYQCVNILHFLNHHRNKFCIQSINGEKYVSLDSNQNTKKDMDNNMEVWDVYKVQYWLWKLYKDSKHNNILQSQWDNILSLFQAHDIDGVALLNLTQSDLFAMQIESIGTQKFITTSIEKLKKGTNETQFNALNNIIDEDLNDDDEDDYDVYNNDDDEDSTINNNQSNIILSEENFYECLIDNHKKMSSKEDNFIYQHEILKLYDIINRQEWFTQHLINHYYHRFHINYYHFNGKKYLKLNPRQESNLKEVDDEELKKRMKNIVEDHPIGIDIVSLLYEYQLRYDGYMFKYDNKDQNLTHKLKSLDLIVTTSSSGYIVFDSYS